MGLGRTSVKGRFIGDSSGDNDAGVTDSSNTEQEDVQGSQFVFGTSYLFNPIFVAFEVDVFRDPVFSAKIGYRF